MEKERSLAGAKQNRYHSLRLNEADAPQDILEAGIGSHTIKVGINPQVNEIPSPFVKRLVESIQS